MSEEDRAKWDEKWQDMMRPAAPSDLLQAKERVLPGGLAVDVACGLGQNALWLARHGYQVLGVDISHVALQRARRRARHLQQRERVLFVQVDLDRWRLPRHSVDLVCVFRFLDRDLFPMLKEAVRPGGYLFYQTRHVGLLQRLPQSNPDFLLKRGELPGVFFTWNVLTYTEGAEDARLVAQKPR